MDEWSPGDAAAVVGNPFYAVEFDPVLCEPHEPLISEDKWIAANKRAIEEDGAEPWLRTLLATLKGEGPSSEADAARFSPEDVVALTANPFYAIQLDPGLAAPHQPLVEENVWVAANASGLKELGSDPWLRNLLVVLKGATAERLATVPKVGRNEPCPCGSGLKYKQCHGK